MAKSGKKDSTHPRAAASIEPRPNGLTVLELYMISDDVRNGKADASEARKLIEVFCAMVDAEAPIHRWHLLHLRDSFRSYLDNRNQGMESAFGLKRRKGRPNVPEPKRIEIAREVLKLRLHGMRHQDALEEVSQRRHRARSEVGKDFARYLLTAMVSLSLQTKFTSAQKAVLHNILDQKQYRAWARATSEVAPRGATECHGDTLAAPGKSNI